MMPRTLFAKLSLALFVLFVVVGVAFLHASLNSAYMYQQEVAQRLNHDLAKYIVHEHVQLNHGEVDRNGLKNLFHNVMIINPSLELYLLDATGKVKAYSVDPGKVVRDSVSLEAINRVLSDTVTMPVLGDDPRSLTRQKAFSVAPIEEGGVTRGYIYAVLGSEQVDVISELIQQSFIMRESVNTILLALAFAFIGGLVIFFLLTRRLRKLSHSMDVFRKQDFEKALAELPRQNSKDEIGVMADTFQQMAQQIQAQLLRLKETDALRRELVANVSHDLRTPLATLKGYIETLMLKNDQLSETDRLSYLQIAHRSSERLNKLVTELFELAKLDAGELKLHKESFSLAELAHDVVHKFDLRAEQLGLALEVNIDSEVPYVEADIGLIERVLDNLVDNAMKHTPSGGTIKLELNADSNQVSVIVADNGHGIAQEDLAHIFQRFYKKPGSDEELPGAGLGLAIAQRILELHGSKLAVDSILHQGTRFDFALPLQTHL
jgi:two-component system OmpR family sensor kinase